MKRTFAFSFILFSLLFISCSKRGDVTIVYTNDVHSFIANTVKDADGNKKPGLSYSTVAALKKDLISQGKAVALVDAGDHIQGTCYGALDQGESVIKFMNAAGYDAAALGNHEFDYGVDRMLELMQKADFPYLACNFFKTSDGKPLAAPYKVLRLGKSRVAFVGIMTPETYSKAAPTIFMDKEGKKYLYKIMSGDDGRELYECVQKTLNEARRKSDYVVALGHLGVDASSVPYTSEELIANTYGIDVFIDGHSHTYIDGRFVKNKKGKDTLLTQAGCYFNAIGLVELSDKKISSRLIGECDLSDKVLEDLQNGWIEDVNSKFGKKIASCAFPLCAYTPDEKHARLVRRQESNLGDFVADAIYYCLNKNGASGCDIAFVNGGSVRTDIPAGGVSLDSVKTVMPFGDLVCSLKLTGRQIFDALEYSVRYIGVAETGSFLHAAGLKYSVDASVPSSTKINSKKMWVSNEAPYRISGVQVYDKKSGSCHNLELEKEYIVAGLNFFMREKGDGYTMFDNAEIVNSCVGEDFIIVSEYAGAFKKGSNGLSEISSENSPLSSLKNYPLDYENPNGSGRITIKK
ncbi:MAG: bifunctional metallophosphatase/5'-nucleotidase [Treponema sp.]|nr:bifunctional metallophosphatase/5'-nucleotidase [Treponema sp.]